MKPNVWKKIPSVIILIIIILMKVPYIHTSAGTCKYEIQARSFQLQNRNFFLTVNNTRQPDLVKMKKKYVLCSFQPKDVFTYYLFDMKRKHFICPGEEGIMDNRTITRPIARKWHRKDCLWEEHILQGYTHFYANNNSVEMYMYKPGVMKRNQRLSFLDVSTNLPYGQRETYCQEQLKIYCRKKLKKRTRHMKHEREFRDEFCTPECLGVRNV